MSGFDTRMVRDTYSSIADRYAAMYAGDVGQLALNRAMLDALAGRVAGRGPVVDLGCGPGQVGAYLGERGCDVVGVDPAAGMLALARRRVPGFRGVGGDVRRLPLRAGACAGVVAFWVFHHVPRGELRATLRELRRVLVPGGALLFATHAGEGEFTAEGIGGAEVTGTLYADEELAEALAAESFSVGEVRHRDPLPPHERQGDRVYVAATAEP